MAALRLKTALLALFALLLGSTAAAQSPLQSKRGPRTIVRGGMFQRADSLQLRADSLAREAMARQIDSILAAEFTADSLALTALRTDDIARTDSLLRDSLSGPRSLLPPASPRHKGWFMSDSMSLSKVCWLSTVLPGYGQVYNKQYWKLPILYGLVGGGLALYINENRTYKPLRRKFDAITDVSMVRTPELNALQQKMIRSNTRRQLYLGVTIASYIYFIGDAAVNYSTNEVSNVKKATTLACICPGAGQIYNKSYWKVPFVVGGFASLIYCIDWNNRGFQRFKKAYNLPPSHAAPPAPPPTAPTATSRAPPPPPPPNTPKDAHRRNRDLCIIITAGLYVLQIIDAHVDAHLKDYDISDDLSMNLEPMVDYTYVPTASGHRPVFGFNLSLNF